ncbi:SPFH domain-containing protein [Melissospora conviva]|uniref:SPFH domain-containing protein n=1 Tax=Melissospora conviva TaxID=3388432 RepID=UPI003C182BFD
MGFMDKLRGELIDIIEFLDDSRDTIVWRFPRHGNEIKMGAKLIVRESQTAVFVNEGQIADVFPPGTYELQTKNMPILSTLKGWKYGFQSPFKAEVYFVNTRRFTDMKWGTQNPITLRDAEFGMVRVRAFGAFAVQVTDPVKLLRELVGTDPQFRTEEVQDYLRQVVVGRLGPVLAGAGVPMLDLAMHQHDLSIKLAGLLTTELAEVGIAIPRFVIENISLPPEVEKALDKRSSMGILGNMNQYTQFQAANALEQAAANPGGASEGMSLGLGLAAGQQMAATLAGNAAQPTPVAPAAAPTPAAAAAPPPLPAAAEWFIGVNGQQQGPFDAAALAAQVSGGGLTAETLVWKTGMAGWVPAAQVPEIAALLAAAPPPLPPQ